MGIITELANSKNKLYSNFFSGNKFLDGKSVYNSWSWRYKKPSNNSFSFVQINDLVQREYIVNEEIKTLHHLFQFANSELFDIKFSQAVEGDGQEWRRITTLHSSSLIALLCFYNIEGKPLTYTMSDGTRCKFTHSYFECQNKIKNAPRPSNIDIVLTGINEKTDKQVILFLESKFSEYLSGGKKDGISNHVYGRIYNDIKIDGLNFIPNKNEETWTIQSKKGQSHYCEGIKQMISHYLGIMTEIDDGHFGKVNSANDYFEKIYLGEILYQFPEDIDNGKFKNYATIYHGLASHLNGLNDKNNQYRRFSVIPEIITYQMLFNGYKLDECVKDFYKL
ncbi:MAG: hypothetical protein IKN91_03955 [Paludibacteraceae bacterium]|nr:hypothetical protein [Paludibacteraceae bacterium]